MAFTPVSKRGSLQAPNTNTSPYKQQKINSGIPAKVTAISQSIISATHTANSEFRSISPQVTTTVTTQIDPSQFFVTTTSQFTALSQPAPAKAVLMEDENRGQTESWPETQFTHNFEFATSLQQSAIANVPNVIDLTNDEISTQPSTEAEENPLNFSHEDFTTEKGLFNDELFMSMFSAPEEQINWEEILVPDSTQTESQNLLVVSSDNQPEQLLIEKYKKGRLLLDSGKYREAIVCFNDVVKSIKLLPRELHANLFYDLGRTYLQLDQLEFCYSALENSIQLSLNLEYKSQVIVLLSLLFIHNKEIRKAEDLIRKEILKAFSNPAEIYDLLLTNLKINPSFSDEYKLLFCEILGKISLFNGMLLTSQFEGIFKIGKSFKNVSIENQGQFLIVYGRGMEARGETTKAMELYQQVASGKVHDDLKAHASTLIALLQLNHNLDEAVETCSKALKLKKVSDNIKAKLIEIKVTANLLIQKDELVKALSLPYVLESTRNSISTLLNNLNEIVPTPNPDKSSAKTSSQKSKK